MIALILALLKPRRYHHRATGPVTIDPDVAETIHIWGVGAPTPREEH